MLKWVTHGWTNSHWWLAQCTLWVSSCKNPLASSFVQHSLSIFLAPQKQSRTFANAVCHTCHCWESMSKTCASETEDLHNNNQELVDAQWNKTLETPVHRVLVNSANLVQPPLWCVASWVLTRSLRWVTAQKPVKMLEDKSSAMLTCDVQLGSSQQLTFTKMSSMRPGAVLPRAATCVSSVMNSTHSPVELKNEVEELKRNLRQNYSIQTDLSKLTQQWKRDYKWN